MKRIENDNEVIFCDFFFNERVRKIFAFKSYGNLAIVFFSKSFFFANIALEYSNSVLFVIKCVTDKIAKVISI